MRIASASWHALSVDAGRGSPVASMAHPPKSCDSSLSSTSLDVEFTTSSTRVACATTSGPGLGSTWAVYWLKCTSICTNSVSWQDNDAKAENEAFRRRSHLRFHAHANLLGAMGDEEKDGLEKYDARPSELGKTAHGILSSAVFRTWRAEMCSLVQRSG